MALILFSTFLGPNGTRFTRAISGPKKSLDFQGPPLPMPLVSDVAPLKIITYRAIKTTGTLIVIFTSNFTENLPSYKTGS
jgi:hypothetical protein